MIKLGTNEIRVDAALPWPVFDQHGRLLLNQGEIVASENALRILMERGLYRQQTPEELRQAAPRIEDRIIPFNALNDSIQRLQQVCSGLKNAREGSVERVIKLARDLQQLCELDADAILGAIHLCQEHVYSLRHQMHAAILCEMMGRRLDYTPEHRRIIICAALTANIAMMELQDVLYRQDSPLTEQQRHAVRQHPNAGEELLKTAGVSDPLWLQIVRQHHERVDGAGYCEGLAGEAIIEEAKLLALADIYSAMVSSRAYRPQMQAKEALREMFLARGKEVGEQLCAAFIKEMGLYPPGSFVRLVNGEVAVVIRRGKDAKSPQVSSVQSPRGGPYMKPLRRDTGLKEYAIQEFCSAERGLQLNLPMIWGYTDLIPPSRE